MARNSKIILCKDIKLDRDYKNVLNYSEAEMLALCQENAVASALNYSFIEPNKSIMVNFTYEQCLQSNYIAFQNPKYSNKWFFAFIDTVEYKSDASCRITFKIDAWSTWFGSWTPGMALVIREHVNDDTIGKHTIPEGLEHGEYIINSVEYDEYNISDVSDIDKVCYIISSSYNLDIIENNKYVYKYGGTYAGVYSGNTYWGSRVRYGTGIAQKLTDVNAKGQIDGINGLFVAPKWVVGVLDGDEEDPISGNVYTSTGVQSVDINVPRNTSIGSSKFGTYNPKNNKLFTGEYNFLLVNNGAGGTAKYNWEDFINNQAQFKMYGALCPGCSIKLTPHNYQDDINSDKDSLMLGKYPQLNWSTDAYLTWLSQNAVNNTWDMAQKFATAGTQMIGGVVTGTGPGEGVGTAVDAILGQMREIRKHEFDAPQNRGNVNSGDITYSSGYNRFQFYRMTIKPEYARQVDSFLTRFGYKINELKVPNITGRTYWNFIQISSSDDIGSGSVPTLYMEEINNIARSGVTIWHDHDNIGDFSLDNTIVQ